MRERMRTARREMRKGVRKSVTKKRKVRRRRRKVTGRREIRQTVTITGTASLALRSQETRSLRVTECS
jgi:hypothetical protein